MTTDKATPQIMTEQHVMTLVIAEAGNEEIYTPEHFQRLREIRALVESLARGETKGVPVSEPMRESLRVLENLYERQGYGTTIGWAEPIMRLLAAWRDIEPRSARDHR